MVSEMTEENWSPPVKKCGMAPCSEPVSDSVGRGFVCHTHGLEFLRRGQENLCGACGTSLPEGVDGNLCPKCLSIAKTFHFFDTAVSIEHSN